MAAQISSPQNKYYLSGIDWVISAFDYTMKKTTSSGNASQIVVEMDPAVDSERLESTIIEFTKYFPVLFGTVVRNMYNLAPYWRVARNGNNRLNIETHSMNGHSSANGLMPFFEKSINTPFRDKNEHLAFRIIQADSKKTYLTMIFDHRLLDAHGAETLLDLLRRFVHDNSDRSIFHDIRLTAPLAMSSWKKRLHAGRNINRKFIAWSRTAFDSLSSGSGKNVGFRFNVNTFDAEETKAIYRNAENEAGYLMGMAYLLAAVLQGMQNLFKTKGVDSPRFLIGISVDMRKTGEKKQKLFFNHWSYMFFQIQVDAASTRKELIHAIKQQMYDQVKTNFSGDFAESSFLFRFVPLRVLGKWLNKELLSFVFSFMSKGPFVSSEFMGTNVTNLFHLPRVPVPPGLGFFFNYFNGLLNFVISYREGLLHNDEIALLERVIQEQIRTR